MKATLVIEVPDDWKKGHCSLCKMRRHDNFGNMYCPLLGRKELPKTDEDCPLEIQYEHISCGRCKHNNECYEVSGSDTCRFEPIGE